MPVDNEPPSWIDNFGSIETDIQAMEEFAATLAHEVETGYQPHLEQVTAIMLTKVPEANPEFAELQSFLQYHHEVQQQTFSNTFNFSAGTRHFASAAQEISDEYQGSDAYANAKVKDVDRAFTVTDPSFSIGSEGGTKEGR
ncbi:hypothetical protein [Actinoplanes sp. NPDC026623]|uniref:hypothetical protein n=1 Tax=Actinoplanes sp. NPDC026623 TaxID=3155610 RepID=UPI0033FF9A78